MKVFLRVAKTPMCTDSNPWIKVTVFPSVLHEKEKCIHKCSQKFCFGDNIWRQFKYEVDPARSLLIKSISTRHTFTVYFSISVCHTVVAPQQEAGSEETITGWLHCFLLTIATNITSLPLLTEKQPLCSTETLQVWRWLPVPLQVE